MHWRPTPWTATTGAAALGAVALGAAACLLPTRSPVHRASAESVTTARISTVAASTAPASTPAAQVQTLDSSLSIPTSNPVLVTRNGDLTPVVDVGGFITAIGGQIDGAMAVTRRAPGSYTVIGRGTDGAMWSYDGREGHYSWTRAGGKLS